jgi:membrane-bound serine protease (ClpP class)
MYTSSRSWLLAAVALLLAATASAAREAVVIPIDGAIGTATAEFVTGGIAQARDDDAVLVVLRMDTPGGLDQAMRDIIKSILASQVPIASFVAPPGARAASAGTYILYASHVAAMAPATNLGAATPVQVGGGGLPGLGDAGDDDTQTDEANQPPPGDAGERKLINDAVAYIRGLADLRGRNADWAERAVRESVSLASGAAAEQRVIDLVADDVDDLLAAIDGRIVSLPGGDQTLDTADISWRELEPDWRVRLLSIITNPNVAYLLMLLGFYGLIFELSNPGAIVPGVVGAVSLLLALYALQLLPVNYAGMALMLLGIALMIGEAFVPSFGALGLGGVAAFVIGSVMLIDAEVVTVSLPLVGVTGLLSASFSIWVIGRFVSLRHRRPVSGTEHLLGLTAEAREDFDGDGHVRVEGEIWRAHSERPVRRGQPLRVTAVRGLCLDVEPEQQE